MTRYSRLFEDITNNKSLSPHGIMIFKKRPKKMQKISLMSVLWKLAEINKHNEVSLVKRKSVWMPQR